MKKNISLTELIALDATLDTLVFGRPLGLFGELADTDKNANKPKEFTLGDAYKVFNKFMAECGVTSTEETPTKSIIGKMYEVRGNSYATCKTYDGIEVGGLHGKVYEIVSDPYVAKVKSILDKDTERIMVDVRSTDTDLVYSVLFEESWMIADNGKSYWENHDAKNHRGLMF